MKGLSITVAPSVDFSTVLNLSGTLSYSHCPSIDFSVYLYQPVQEYANKKLLL